MFCKFCGAEMTDDSSFCAKCGKSSNEQNDSQPKKKVPNNAYNAVVVLQSYKHLGIGMALSFVFGGVGLLYSSVTYGLVFLVCDVLACVVTLFTPGSIFVLSLTKASRESSEALGFIFVVALLWLLFSRLASMVLSWYCITRYNDNLRRGILNRDFD